MKGSFREEAKNKGIKKYRLGRALQSWSAGWGQLVPSAGNPPRTGPVVAGGGVGAGGHPQEY